MIQNLVYDIGLHRGEDTELYLKKGFRVVALEANPLLVEECRNRFADAIESGALTIISGAVVEGQSSGEIEFFMNRRSVWGTVATQWTDKAEKRGGFVKEVVLVPIIDFDALLREYGVPYYMKIDIEGMDMTCLRALERVNSRPEYVSIESEKKDFNALLNELEMLAKLGYRSFQAVQQFGVSRQREPHHAGEGSYSGHIPEEGSSGFFGRDLDPTAWLNRDDVVNQYVDIFTAYRLFGDNGKFTSNKAGRLAAKAVAKFLKIPAPGWYDTHARLAT